jgi:hypothetical protein
LGGEGEVCSNDAHCEPGMFCADDGSWALFAFPANRCWNQLDVGLDCRRDEQCETLKCGGNDVSPGTIASCRELDGECRENRHCDTFACADGWCSNRGTDDPCDEDGDCDSGQCLARRCQ